MPLVSLRQLLDHAAENGYGLPAFNVNNMEQVCAIMDAAAELDAPVIMQASAGARKYAGEAFLRHQILAAIEAYPNIPIVMHQDHGQSPAVCMAAIRSGFSWSSTRSSVRRKPNTALVGSPFDVVRGFLTNAKCARYASAMPSRRKRRDGPWVRAGGTSGGYPYGPPGRGAGHGQGLGAGSGSRSRLPGREARWPIRQSTPVVDWRAAPNEQTRQSVPDTIWRV